MIQKYFYALIVVLIFGITLSGCGLGGEKENPEEDSYTSESSLYVQETSTDESAKEADVTIQEDYTAFVSDEKILQMTQEDIEALSDQELIGLGQRIKQGNFEERRRKHEFTKTDSQDVHISGSSASDYASAEKIAEEYFTPANDNYWYTGFEFLEETETYWLFMSYYNNQNVVNEPDYLLVFASTYYDCETSQAGFELNEENIREFVSIYGVPLGGFCLAEFVNQEEETYEYINYNFYISGGDYGLCDTVHLEKYVLVFQKEGHVLKGERQELKTAEIPGSENRCD